MHSGTYAAHFKHTCEHDWSFMSTEQVSVGFEEKYELSYWVKVSGPANFKVGVVLYNGSSEAILNWDAASAPEKNDTHGEWVQVTGTVWIINSQMSSPYITVRCVGRGRGEAYVDDIVLKSIGKFPLFLDFSTGVEGSVEMQMDSQTGEINVTMPGTKLAWKQKKVWGPKITRIVSHDAKSVAVELSEGFTATISLTEGLPEIVYRIASNGTSGLQMFPHPFVSTEGHVVIPLNEGISFPVTSVGDIGKQFYSLANGHGLCMAFW